ncbi:MAG: hypothetical protein ABSG65_35635 [Bryobacteraceae bacterium]|jgi:hypothetical protein
MWEPLIPKEISDWMDLRGWGMHHQLWHYERWWDREPNLRVYVTQHGGARADRQEGDPGNGLDFMAMHRTMIRAMQQYFPRYDGIWYGWKKVPTDPDDPADPTDVMPANGSPRDFDPDKLKALDRLEHNLDGFNNDDDLGLFIETSFRPVPGNPEQVSSDPSTGIHSYLHDRFALNKQKTCDPDFGVSMSDFFGNIKNQRFWRLHGWIDRTWTRFRDLKKLHEDDPAYQAALRDQAMPLNEMPDMCSSMDRGPSAADLNLAVDEPQKQHS